MDVRKAGLVMAFVMLNATTPPAITTVSTAGGRPTLLARTTIKAQYKGHETMDTAFVVVAKSEDTATIVVMERMLASIVLPPAENATNYSWTQDKSIYIEGRYWKLPKTLDLVSFVYKVETIKSRGNSLITGSFPLCYYVYHTGIIPFI